MTIKEIRKITGLNQEQFAKRYSIPISNLRNWEASPDASYYHAPPEYAQVLLEKVVMYEYEVIPKLREHQSASEDFIKRLLAYKELLDKLDHKE